MGLKKYDIAVFGRSEALNAFKKKWLVCYCTSLTWAKTSLNSGSQRSLMLLTFHHVVLLLLLRGLKAVTEITAKANLGVFNNLQLAIIICIFIILTLLCEAIEGSFSGLYLFLHWRRAGPSLGKCCSVTKESTEGTLKGVWLFICLCVCLWTTYATWGQLVTLSEPHLQNGDENTSLMGHLWVSEYYLMYIK